MSSCIFVFTHVANILHSTYSLMHRVETKTFHFMEKFRGKQEGIWGMVIQFSSFPPLWVFSSFLWNNFYPLHKADRTIIKANSSWIPPCFDFLAMLTLSADMLDVASFSKVATRQINENTPKKAWNVKLFVFFLLYIQQSASRGFFFCFYFVLYLILILNKRANYGRISKFKVSMEASP